MNKKTKLGVAAMVVAMMLTTGGCKDHRQVPAEKAVAMAEKVEVSEEKTEATAEPEAVVATDKEDVASEGYPSTYDEPKGKVLELLKDYNAHMDDYSTTGVTALGMGTQGSRVLLNFTIDDYRCPLSDKEKMKTVARELIEAMPIGQKVAWRCIPEEGYALMVTFVGRQSSKIVSVVFTKEELKEIVGR